MTISNNTKRSKTQKDKKMLYVRDYPRELRGFSQNRFGGQRTQRLRTYGGKFGTASPVRQLKADEIKSIEDDLKKNGYL
jgi:hypothetical protein